MTLAEYQQCVRHIGFGKKLPTALYVYRDESASLGAELDRLIGRVVATFQIGPEFNLLKLRTDELKLSFLAYPQFFENAHPALARAFTLDLASGKARHTDYAPNPNPPILHRKESFLPSGHPRRAEFEALTRQEEAAGLYKETATIGFKLNWDRLLAEKRLAIDGHTLRTSDPAAASADLDTGQVEVQRHKTAMTRYDLTPGGLVIAGTETGADW